MEYKVKTTPLLEWLTNTPSEYEIIGLQGGTSGGKTFTLMEHLIFETLEDKASRATIAAGDAPRINRGAASDFDAIMKLYPFLKETIDKETTRPKNVRFKNGSLMEFVAYDSANKAHNGKRDRLFLNEANHIAFSIAEQLEIRTSKRTYLDYNPTAPFWYMREWQHRKNCITYYSNYLDNYYINDKGEKVMLVSQKIIDGIEAKKHDKNWYNVYGLGKTGMVEELIYSHELISEMPPYLERVAYGLDFGYSDPTVLVKGGLFEGKAYFETLIHETGLTSMQTLEALIDAGIPRNAHIFADNARPETIKEISTHRHGYRNMVGQAKMKIVERIALLQNFMPLHVLHTDRHFINEVEMYKYKRDRNGKILNEPAPYQDDHCMDAAGYLAVGAWLGLNKRPKRRRRTGNAGSY